MEEIVNKLQIAITKEVIFWSYKTIMNEKDVKVIKTALYLLWSWYMPWKPRKSEILSLITSYKPAFESAMARSFQNCNRPDLKNLSNRFYIYENHLNPSDYTGKKWEWGNEIFVHASHVCSMYVAHFCRELHKTKNPSSPHRKQSFYILLLLFPSL